MFERRSLKLPITLGVTMIVLLVVLTVGWVLLSLFGASHEGANAPLYWTLLSVGSVFLVFVLVGVVLYLTLSIKAINLTRRQSNFIDSVTHELKSPIASLKLYLQTLNRRPVTPEQRDDFQRVMLEDVERLDHLINHLLDAGRVEKSPQPSEFEDVELTGLLKQCAALVCARRRVPESTVQLSLTPCIVRARAADLHMVFGNLIDNALKYSGPDPRIEITARLHGRLVTIDVRDYGPGIPVAERRRIFGRFVRLGLELERKQTGTGLGLYIVRTLVRRLRGTVRVRDPEPGSGSGTVFEVKLPVQALTNAPTSPGPASQEFPPAVSPLLESRAVEIPASDSPASEVVTAESAAARPAGVS